MDRMKETVQKISIFREEDSKLFRNGEHTMTMLQEISLQDIENE